MSNDDLCYMIFCGTSPYAIVNSIWASIDIRKLCPSKIVLLATERQRGLSKIISCVKNLTEDTLKNNCLIQIVTISQSDIEENKKILNDHVKEIKDLNTNFAIDITPGRKTMSISGLLFVHSLQQTEKSIASKFLHIIYWHLIDSGKYTTKWYPEIPRANFHFVDLKEVIQ